MTIPSNKFNNLVKNAQICIWLLIDLTDVVIEIEKLKTTPYCVRFPTIRQVIF